MKRSSSVTTLGAHTIASLYIKRNEEAPIIGIYEPVEDAVSPALGLTFWPRADECSILVQAGHAPTSLQGSAADR